MADVTDPLPDPQSLMVIHGYYVSRFGEMFARMEAKRTARGWLRYLWTDLRRIRKDIRAAAAAILRGRW